MTTSRKGPVLSHLDIAERMRDLLGRWVRTTRDQAGTPTSATIETLGILHREGPASIAELANRRSVKHQSMRLIVEQLVAEATVTKKPDLKDRRSQLISITAKGRRFLEKQQSARTLWISELLLTCPPEELGRVVMSLDTMEALLSKAPPRRPSTPA